MYVCKLGLHTLTFAHTDDSGGGSSSSSSIKLFRRQASQARVWDKVGRALVGQAGTTGLLKAAH